MANQVIVTKDHTVQVSVTPTPQVQVQLSRAAINAPLAGVTQIVAGNNIDITPDNGVGIVTINATANITSSKISNGTSSVDIATVNGPIISNVSAGNSYTLQYQDSYHWEVYPEDDTTGPYATWAWINASLNNGDPIVMIESQPRDTGIPQRWTFDAHGNLTLPGNAAYQSSIIFDAEQNVYIQQGMGALSLVANNKSWTFNSDGNLSVPGSITTSGSGGDISGANVITANYFVGNGGNLTNINGSNVSNVANADHANIADAANVAYSVAGANVTGTVANATYADTSGVADSANSVAGANVTGTVANATYADTSGVAYSVDLANVVGIGNIASINLDANVSNILAGDGSWIPLPTVSSNANYANFAGTAFAVDGANVNGAVAYATTANSVAGANVTGTVANAAYATNAGSATTANSANSVTLANVSGAGNIASINLDGSASNVLYGNGVFGAVSIPTASSISNGTSNVSIPTANGNITVSAAGNAWTFGTDGNIKIPGGGQITTFYGGGLGNSIRLLAPNGFSAAGTTSNNGLGAVSVYNRGAFGANYEAVYITSGDNTYGNGLVYQRSNDGASYVFQTYGTGTFRFNLGNLVSANYVAGTLTTAAQPNITSVGILTSLAVTGNISGANLTGNHFGNGSALTSITGANVIGTVANATYATSAGTADTVTTAAQPNITSVGTLSALTVNGNSDLGAVGNVIITGGTANYVLQTDGAGNLSWAAQSGGGGSNFANYAGVVTTAAQPNITSVGNLTSVTTTGNVNLSSVNTGLSRVVLSTPTYGGVFNGTTQYLTVPANAAFAFGTGNFTAECWVYLTSYNPFAQLLGTHDYGVAVDWLFYVNGSGQLSYLDPGAGVLNFPTVVTQNTWHHVALVRNSGIITAYIDGVNAGASFSSSYNITNNSIPFSIGAAPNAAGPSFLSGSVTNARVVKGIAVYTSAFTVPNNPLAATQSSNVNGNPSAAIAGAQTSILTLQDVAIVDNSTYAFTITNNGPVTTTPVSIFGATQTTFLTDGATWQSTPIEVTGNLSASGLIKFASYTVAELTAITGTVGQAAAVSDSSPPGKLAYWSSNSWLYVSSDSAI